jgi:hypothetical protein
MIGAAIVAAPAVAAAMAAVKPEFATSGTLAPGVPYLVGESSVGTYVAPTVEDLAVSCEVCGDMATIHDWSLIDLPPEMDGGYLCARFDKGRLHHVCEKHKQTLLSPNQVRNMEDERVFTIEEVCRHFQVPPHMVGSLAQSLKA